jgi:four helix bundle protein
MPDTGYRIWSSLLVSGQSTRMPYAVEKSLKTGRSGTVGYRRLKIWKLARELSVDIHNMTLDSLPKFEMFEQGAQIRRSCKSVRANIVEGYGRRRYKQDFIRFLCYAESSCDETIDHLETLFETNSLTDADIYESIHSRLSSLSKMINRFLSSVEEGHVSVREENSDYEIHKDRDTS